MRIRIATRGSPLARWQAERVADLLRTVDPDIDVEFVVVATTGDLDRTTPLEQLGGQGVFVKEVQAAVLDGRADLAVHSAKDLPALTPDGRQLVTGAVDNTIRIWNFETGRVLRVLQSSEGAIWSIAITPDGQQYLINLKERRKAAAK
jgi:WD40 repeat protein